MKIDYDGLKAGLLLITIAALHRIVVNFETWLGVFGRYFIAVMGLWILIGSQVTINTSEKRTLEVDE